MGFFFKIGAAGRTNDRFLSTYLEDILETAIISLQNGVLGRHVQRPFFLQSHDKAGMSKVSNALVGIVHSHDNSAAIFEGEQRMLDGRSAIGSIGDFHFSRSRNDNVASFVLIAVGVTSNANGFSPAGN